jgi:hypothetical protein
MCIDFIYLAFPLSDYELNGDVEQCDEEDEYDKEDEVINNLQTVRKTKREKNFDFDFCF